MQRREYNLEGWGWGGGGLLKKNVTYITDWFLSNFVWIDSTKLYILIMWMTLTLMQGCNYTRKQKHLRVFSHKLHTGFGWIVVYYYDLLVCAGSCKIFLHAWYSRQRTEFWWFWKECVTDWLAFGPLLTEFFQSWHDERHDWLSFGPLWTDFFQSWCDDKHN